MRRHQIKRCRIPVSLGIGLALFLTGELNVSKAGPKELIRNGGFEKKLKKWITRSSSRIDGRFSSDTVQTTTPFNFYATAGNPRGGKRYAIADQRDKSYQILIQKFRIPRNARRVTLSYQMFVESFDPVVKNPDVFSLDEENQHGRVDLLRGNATAKETGTGVVRKLYSKGADVVDSPATPARYIRYRFNLTPDVTPGRSYQIRYAVIATEDELLMGVDNVSVKAR